MAKIKDSTCSSTFSRPVFMERSAPASDRGPWCTSRVAARSGWLAVASCHLLGAAVVIVGDRIPERLAQARSFGCETVDISQAPIGDQVADIVGEPEVDSAVDCVGFEARGHGDAASREVPAAVLNSLMEVTRAGGAIGIPGLYVTGDPGGVDDAAKVGALSIRIGLGWANRTSSRPGSAR